MKSLVTGLAAAAALTLAAVAPAAAQQNSRIIVVSHGALIREVLGHATAEELLTPGVRIANGAHFVLRWERDRVTLQGDAAGALV